jgi:hypothetical protein
MRAFTGYLKQAPRGPATAQRRRHIPPAARGDALHRLTEAGASDRYRDVFEMMNEMPNSGRAYQHGR